MEAVAVPEKLHPLAAKTLAAARKAQPERNGAITGLGGEVLRIRAHPDTLDRVRAFLNALVYDALARGYRFEAGREGLVMIVDDEAIGCTACQMTCPPYSAHEGLTPEGACVHHAAGRLRKPERSADRPLPSAQQISHEGVGLSL